MNDSRSSEKPDWKNHGLRIIRSGDLNTNTPQTPGMTRAEAISRARARRRAGVETAFLLASPKHPNYPMDSPNQNNEASTQ